MIDFEKIIEFDNLTIGDCISMYIECGKRVVINDGKVIGINEE